MGVNEIRKEENRIEVRNKVGEKEEALERRKAD